MAIKKIKKSSDKKDKKKREPNWLLRFTIVVFLIPLIILLFVILTSLDSSTSPVVGSRFNNQLDPAITDDNIKSIEDSLKYAEAQNVEVNLKSATLRITIDCKDDCNEDQIKAIVDDAYGKVAAVLPIEKYFTNSKDTKMYDLEISVYNMISDDKTKEIYVSKNKSGAAKEAVTDVISSPRNQEVVDQLNAK